MPPAAVQGNIYNKNKPEEVVLGYFELSNTDSLRGFITKGDLNEEFLFPKNVCPTITNPSPANGIDGACCNCQSIKNASLERPSWF